MERFLHEDFPEATFYPESDCAVDHLVWNNLDLQLNHFGCHSEHRQSLLRNVYRRVNYNLKDGTPGFWKRQKHFVHYDATATIVAMSSYENRDNVCACGFHKFSCGDRAVCLRCSYNLLAAPAIEEFVNAFGARARTYYLVLSLSSDPDERNRIIFKDLTTSEMQQLRAHGCLEQGKLSNYGILFSAPADVLDARIYWDIFAEVIHEFTGQRKPLTGAFGGPELAVRFMPLGVLPHANYVGFSDGLTLDDVRELRRELRKRLRGCRRLTHRLYPKVAVYCLPSKPDLREVIDYIFKPIGFAIPYKLSADKLDYQPAGMKSLNADVNLFLDHIGIAFEGLDRMNRYGVCSPSAGKKNYIGVVTEQRLERRQDDWRRRRERRKEAENIKEMFPDYKPHKRRKSAQGKYDLFLMRVYYRKMIRDGECPDTPARLKRLLRKSSAKNATHPATTTTALNVTQRKLN